MILNFRHFINFSSILRLSSWSRMGTFVSNVNPVTGKMEWSLQAENYDYHQEIARSAYADMLHDTERNRKYFEGLKKAVSSLRAKGNPVHVLDIGTGTGLLSMMAAQLGADTVTACEAFHPMADCAEKVIKQNGFHDKIKLIPKRSTEVTVGGGGDMTHRANILVTEVFDTELIGEGALGTFNHAHKELLEKDCIVVPNLANMYVQLVKSKFIAKWNRLESIQVPGAEDIIPPARPTGCGGAQSLHDLQLDQLPVSKFEKVSDPVRVLRFDFGGTRPLPIENQTVTPVTALTSGTVDAIFMWWDIEMDQEGEIMLSCAPSWGHPKIEDLQWRDHWMQAIYYPPRLITVEKGNEVNVTSSHDEYSLWFDVTATAQILPEVFVDTESRWGPFTYSRTRIGMLNDTRRQEMYGKAVKKHINNKTVCLSLSDGSLLPLVAARLGADKVFAIETSSFCSRLVQSVIEENKLGAKVCIIEKSPEDVVQTDFESRKISLIIGEPFFSSSLLPWHNLYFWYAVSELSDQMMGPVEILPRGMKIKALAVEFKDLWKIRAPVGTCEGFDLSAFDSIIEKSSELTDSEVEPQPLWEYPCRALSDITELMDFDFTQSVKHFQNNKTDKTLQLKSEGSCNGIALWADYDLGDGLSISTGPQQAVVLGERIEWDFHTRQGVHLLRTPIATHSTENSEKELPRINVKLSFQPQNGDLDFEFCAVR